MSENELREFCRGVVKRNRTTKDEKRVIEAECDARGMTLNKRCPNCYVDAAAVIYYQLPEEDAPETGAKWVLRRGVDVLFGGVRVCAATITDELAEQIVARGFKKSFFDKYPE